MKFAAIGLLLAAVTSSAFGADIVPARAARKVPLNAVQVTVEGQPGWPMQHVKVTATFSNDCFVPLADELITVTEYEDNMNTLALTLLSDADRACTLQFDPVTVTIDLGLHVRPADGLFDKIVVNGVKAPL